MYHRPFPRLQDTCVNPSRASSRDRLTTAQVQHHGGVLPEAGVGSAQMFSGLHNEPGRR